MPKSTLDKHEIRNIYLTHGLKATTLIVMIAGAILGYILIDRHEAENKQVDLIIRIMQTKDYQTQYQMLEVLKELYPPNKGSSAMKNFIAAIESGIQKNKAINIEAKAVEEIIDTITAEINRERLKDNPNSETLKMLANNKQVLNLQKAEIEKELKEYPIIISPPSGGVKSQLASLAIAIGHKKSSPGAVNQRFKLSEYEYNEELAYLIQKYLSQVGISSKFVFRSTYRNLPDDINAIGSDVALELHANAFDGKLSGSQISYSNQSENGKKLANILQREIVNVLKLPDRGIKPKSSNDKNGYILHNVKAPIVVTELFFIDNDSDIKIAIEKKEELAQAIARGIKKYLESSNSQ